MWSRCKKITQNHYMQSINKLASWLFHCYFCHLYTVLYSMYLFFHNKELFKKCQKKSES